MQKQINYQDLIVKKQQQKRDQQKHIIQHERFTYNRVKKQRAEVDDLIASQEAYSQFIPMAINLIQYADTNT